MDESPQAPPPKKRASLRSLEIGVFLTVLFAYLLFDSRTPPYNDSRAIYAVAESIVYRHSITIDGTSYAQQAFLPSAIQVPGVALRWALGHKDPGLDRLVKPMTSHVGTQAVVAIGCLVFFRLLLYLGLSTKASSLATLLLAVGTFLPIYARTAWSEALQAVCFTGFFAAVVRLAEDPGRRTGLWFGIWTGLLINAKYVFTLALPGALLIAVYAGWRKKRMWSLVQAGLWSAVPGSVFYAVILWYNWARTGASTNTGYPTVSGLVESVFREDIFWGLWAYLFSFGKSIFLYSPPLALAVFALPSVRRRNPALLWTFVLTAAPVVGLYSKFAFWSGDWCWGPRYLLFIVAPMLVLAAYLIDHYVRERKRLGLVACAAILLVGIWVQIVGGSQYWDHFIRFSRTAQTQWLGSPNRSGALTADKGGACDPCFEDFYARNYTPAFQPIDVQWWYLKHHILNDPWDVAAKDIPMRRYTTLQFASARSWYERPPWDWWKLDYVGRYRWAGHAMLVLFLLGLAGGAVLWIRGLGVVTEPYGGTVPCSSPQPWPRLRAYLGPRFDRLRARLRDRGRSRDPRS
jgi:hypothetical protein